jgi:hypothetical protein
VRTYHGHRTHLALILTAVPLAACGGADPGPPPAPTTPAPAAAALADGGWRLPVPVPGAAAEGVSRDGTQIVLEAADGSSRLLVLSPEDGRQRELDFTAAGDLSYDALSRDGNLLYLNEHVGDEVVRIRVADLASGRLLPDPVVDKIEGESTMAGTARARDVSPDGAIVYTLYDGEEHAFVHALMVDTPVSFCIDLPGGSVPDDGVWSIGVAPGGSEVAVMAGGRRSHLVVDRNGIPALAPAA